MDPEVSFGAWVTRRREVLDLTREQMAKLDDIEEAGNSNPQFHPIFEGE